MNEFLHCSPKLLNHLQDVDVACIVFFLFLYFFYSFNLKYYSYKKNTFLIGIEQDVAKLMHKFSSSNWERDWTFCLLKSEIITKCTIEWPIDFLRKLNLSQNFNPNHSSSTSHHEWLSTEISFLCSCFCLFFFSTQSV